MIPDRTEWKHWTTLEKATYVAQLATLGVLLATVIFSFLTWSEARETRQEQAAFFMSEKMPELEVAAVRIEQGVFIATLHNRGESIAKDVRVDLHLSGHLIPSRYNSRTTLIPKGQSRDLTVLGGTEELVTGIGWPAKVVALDSPTPPPGIFRSNDEYEIYVTYKDAIDQPHELSRKVLFDRLTER